MEIRSDVSKSWWYAVVMLPVALAIGGVMGGLGLLAGEFRSAEAAFVGGIVAGLIWSIALGFCMWWRVTLARTAYRVDDQTLSCRRGDRVLREIDLREVESIEVRDGVDMWEVLLTHPPLSWPTVVVNRRREAVDGKRRTEVWPSLLLVGRRDAEAAESRLRQAIKKATTTRTFIQPTPQQVRPFSTVVNSMGVDEGRQLPWVCRLS